MNKATNKTTKRLLAAVLAVMMVMGMVTTVPKASAKGKKPLYSVSLEPFMNVLNKYDSKEKDLFVGMTWSPKVCYTYADSDKDEDEFSITESVGTLAGVSFTSSNKKVATVNKKGLITAKKAGTAKITISSSELHKTFKVKVLPNRKVSRKKLVSEVKRSKKDWDWPLTCTYDKTDEPVKKGYVKAGKKYELSLYSIRTYQQKDKSKRSVFAYTVKGCKNASYKEQYTVEEILTVYQLCEGVQNLKKGAGDWMGEVAKEDWPAWQTMPTPSQMDKADLKEMKKYARENIYTSDNVFYNAMFRYGWRNMCAG